MKIIVSHFSPDIDSITASWLIARFYPGFKDASFAFVPAGSTYEDKPVDSDSNTIHVDTGFGKFDHHQSQEYTSATQLVFKHLLEESLIKVKHHDALSRMVKVINGLDHFSEVYFKDPSSDHYEFMIHKIIEGGLKSILKEDTLILQSIFPFLDALFNIFIKKVGAESDIKLGFVFNSVYGKSIALSSKNEETMKLALKQGFKLVVKKDPDRGFVRIKTLPDKQLDLKPLYLKILKVDKGATWFLHVSGNMLLNSSSRNPHFIPSSLPISKLIEIIKSI